MLFLHANRNLVLKRLDAEKLRKRCNRSAKCTRARKKQLWKNTKINVQILKENVQEKSDGNFAKLFLNQYDFDSQKKKMEHYNHSEKVKNQF